MGERKIEALVGEHASPLCIDQGTTLITVAHSPAVRRFHAQLLRFVVPSCGGGCVQNASCIACFTACGTWGKGGAWDKCDCPDECYPEGVIADQTIRILKDKVAPGGAAGQPFFHACGFKRPHLSYRAPTKYFDMCTITLPASLLCLLSADSHLLLVGCLCGPQTT